MSRGRDKRIGAGMNDVLNALVGGWELAGNYRYESGQYLRFNGTNNGGMIAPPETPKTLGGVGAGNYWFDTTGFRVQPAFTRRTNPWQYEGLKGPNYKNVDLALAKRVPLKGNTRLNFRIEAYNLLNGMNWGRRTRTSTSRVSGRCRRPMRISGASCNTPCASSSGDLTLVDWRLVD
jgi:hypothetical protein